MVDNFDANVARRKPNTRTFRPLRPWDVSGSDDVPDKPADTTLESSSEPSDREGDKQPLLKDTPDSAPLKESVKIPLPQKKVILARNSRNELSDSININSNFCKLHNDVSDVLQNKLSPSAQSVYLRLYRQSYGWNRNWAAESLPKLKDACNMSLQTVRKAIKDLETIGCIEKVFSDYHKATVYRVFLPSEIGMFNNNMIYNTIINNTGLNIDSHYTNDIDTDSQNRSSSNSCHQIPDSVDSDNPNLKNLDDHNAFSGGQKINIQSIYSLGTSIYNLIETGGPLPINIHKYMTNKHLGDAVHSIDEFYDSIGFSIVSRAQYRKSLIDYFELIKSGFSSDDIRYAVRWTFKNSRTRPESFSLIKHTMHLAMEDLIRDLKHVSGEKEEAEKKQELLKRRSEWETIEQQTNFTDDDLTLWKSVVEDLRETMNEHSFAAFIAPLKLISSESGKVVVGSPPDFASWVRDHFVDKIEESYLEKTGKKIVLEVT
jgi:hypothetical protein